MTTLTKLATAAALAISLGTAGAANASPAVNLSLSTETTAQNQAIQPAFYPGGGYYGGYLCYMPFWKLVQYVGYFQARRIKFNCFYGNYGGYPYYYKKSY